MSSAAAIISASRRTDVPAFHSRWWLNRLRAGWCHSLHPFNATVRRVSLVPEDVRALVFWTRNPGPLLPHLDVLAGQGYPMLFQFTINGYGPPLETHNPPIATALRCAERIVARLGEQTVLWRFDPILLSEQLTEAVHLTRFRKLAQRLEGVTRRCTISFVDLYGKTRRNLAPVEAAQGHAFEVANEGRKRRLAASLAEVGTAHGITVVSCCDDQVVHGAVGKARCIDPAAVAAVGGNAEALPAAPTRKDCGCVRSVDVGVYDTCAFGCRYCYAVSSRKAALARIRGTDPEDSLLWRPPSLRGIDLSKLAGALVKRSREY